jgi:hypothetical protein
MIRLHCAFYRLVHPYISFGSVVAVGTGTCRCIVLIWRAFTLGTIEEEALETTQMSP